MSRFDELDHRLGRHEGNPNPNCAICDPSAVKPDPVGPWDYASLGAPGRPDWGAVWNHRGEMVTFVNPVPSTTGGGFWCPMRPVFNLTPDEPLLNQIEYRPEVQLEMGSGKWHPRARILNMTNTIPDESGLTSPLGVNLYQWAQDQNHARLLVELERKRMFPIAEIRHEKRTVPLTEVTEISSSVRCIELQDFVAFLVDINPR